MADQAKQARMSAARSWIRSAFRASKVVERPPAAREGQRVCFGGWADKLPAGVFRRAGLKAQYRLLASLGAGSAQIRRVPESVFSWLLSKDVDGPRRKTYGFVIGQLLALSYNLGKLLFKFEFFFLRPRQLILKERLLSLDVEHSALCLNEAGQKGCCGLSNFVGVALSDKSFGNGLCSGDGRDGHLNFIEHGCPSDGSVRVEEPALSVGAGGPPSAPAAPVPRAD